MAHTQIIAAISFLAASLLLATHAPRAQDSSSKPIKLLVGASPGGTTDTMARAIASPLSASLGRSMIVENRPGAGGNLAADAVAKSPADGSTLLVAQPYHQRHALSQAAVRSDHRLHADQHDRDRAESAGQPSETAGTGPRIEGATPAGMSAVDFAAFVRADVARWAPIVRQSGARLD